jgi:carboxymethylenebutenolidase
MPWLSNFHLATLRLKQAINAPYQMHMYKNANHGFHNESTAPYDPENAELAWQRTLAFFKEKLSSA